MTDEDTAYELTFEEFLEVYDFAYGRASKFDELDVGCAAIASCMALHKLKANSNLTDIETKDISDMPLREMPEVVEKLRARLKPAFEQAIPGAMQNDK